MIRLEKGIKCGEFFSVDPTRRSDLAVISHAHSDHLRSHKKLIATGPTIDLARLNYKRFESTEVKYNEKFNIGPANVELAPAGHMLGSAQIIIDWNGDRVVYTGDFKLDDNFTCARAKIHPCDILLIDTTYGMPHFKFPPVSECREMLLEFVSKNLTAGVTPVILAYSFGKAQEAMVILSREGIEIDVYKKAYDAAQVYKKHGVDLPGICLLNEKPQPGRAVILPPGAFRHVDPRGWGRFKTCFLSGWVLDRSRRYISGNGYGIPFSDHASFEDIIRYVEAAKPKKTYTLFGPPNIAEYLRRIGFKAEAANLNSGHYLTGSSAFNMELFE